VADGRTHVLVGMVAGGGAALYRGRDLPGPDLLVEAIGGVIGGYAGGKGPDILEPAIHAWHRKFCHSWTAGAAIGAGIATLEAWEGHCRERAANHRCRRLAPGTDPLTAIFLWIGEMFWTLAAGFAAGFGGGYLSHLLLDAATPRSLPLIF
jgi:inner membrane protein